MLCLKDNVAPAHRGQTFTWHRSVATQFDTCCQGARKCYECSAKSGKWQGIEIEREVKIAAKILKCEWNSIHSRECRNSIISVNQVLHLVPTSLYFIAHCWNMRDCLDWTRFFRFSRVYRRKETQKQKTFPQRKLWQKKLDASGNSKTSLVQP